MANYNDDSNILVKKLYPFISNILDKSDKNFLTAITKFMNDKHDQIFDIAPYDVIYYNQTDIDNLFKSLGITEKQIEDILSECFWTNLAYHPQCAKVAYVEVMMMAIRYYLRNNKQKNAELCTIYLLFSGKFYASLYKGTAFPKVSPSKYRTVMDYVINNMLNDKFDLKREGTMFGAIKSLSITWLDTYKDIITKESSDKKFGMVLQQLRDREKSFLMNIAKLYMEAYTNKNYLNYETDNLDEENFRLTDNDAAVASRITENTMNYITSNYVSIDICNKCKDSNVKSDEIRDIIESILSDNNNLDSVRRVINIIICDFMRANPGIKVGTVDFVAYTIKAKPNTKDKYLLEMKDTILKWLDENSPTYRKRKSRKATQISYYRSILMYFTMIINKIARR